MITNGANLTADGRIVASPLARRIAADKGIDLSRVQGTGPGGRIVKADVEQLTATPKLPPLPATPPVTAGQPTWGKLPTEDVDMFPLSRMRRAIADGTVRSKSNTPHFYVTVEADVEPLLALRAEINHALAERGIKVSVNDMLIKALALTLRDFPNLEYALLRRPLRAAQANQYRYCGGAAGEWLVECGLSRCRYRSAERDGGPEQGDVRARAKRPG